MTFLRRADDQTPSISPVHLRPGMVVAHPYTGQPIELEAEAGTSSWDVQFQATDADGDLVSVTFPFDESVEVFDAGTRDRRVLNLPVTWEVVSLRRTDGHVLIDATDPRCDIVRSRHVTRIGAMWRIHDIHRKTAHLGGEVSQIERDGEPVWRTSTPEKWDGLWFVEYTVVRARP